jgi:hypothetical protein
MADSQTAIAARYKPAKTLAKPDAAGWNERTSSSWICSATAAGASRYPRPAAVRPVQDDVIKTMS